MAGGTRSYQLSRRFVKLGMDVTMICSEPNKNIENKLWRDEIIDGVKVSWSKYNYDKSSSRLTKIYAFLAFSISSSFKLIFSKKPDICIATSTPLTIVLPALLLKLFKGTKFIFEVRDVWPETQLAIGNINGFIGFFSKILAWIAYNTASHIVTLAPGMKEDISKNYGIKLEKISVIPQGCDGDMTSASSKSKEEMGFKEQDKLVLYAGALEKVNGVSYLAKLADKSKEIDENIKFIVIGWGSEKEKLINLCQKKELLDANVFFFGPYPKKELAAWMQISDIHLALFTGPKVIWKDAVQNKFFDAMTFSKPIANNFDGWQTKVSIENDFGIYLQPNNIGEAAVDLVDAINDNSWLNSVERKVKPLKVKDFNRDYHAKIYQELMHRVTYDK